MCFNNKETHLNDMRVLLGVMAIERYSTLPRALELKPHHRIHFSFLPKTLLLRGFLHTVPKKGMLIY